MIKYAVTHDSFVSNPRVDQDPCTLHNTRAGFFQHKIAPLTLPRQLQWILNKLFTNLVLVYCIALHQSYSFKIIVARGNNCFIQWL